MIFGVAVALTDRSATPDQVARLVEDRGLESLFVTEHTHVPVAADRLAPQGFPDAYRRTLDPFVALTAAAAATTRLRLGTSVLLAAQHEPLVTAKAVASLDVLSGGRVELGVGAGWLEPEMVAHGVDPQRRGARLREHVEAMRRLWRDDVASFTGEHVHFHEVWSWPKPVQAGGPRVWLGADGPAGPGRAAQWADGWMTREPAVPSVRRRIRALAEACAALGRARLPVTVYNCATDPGSLEAYRDLGVTRGLVRLPSGSCDDLARALDALPAPVYHPA